MHGEARDHGGAPARDAVAKAAAAKILAIDDDPVIRDLRKSFLGKAGQDVVVAAGGEEGLAEARKARPDVITLDVAMPGMDGWSVQQAENGRVALDLARTGAPGLALLDLMMPEMDGFTFLEELRRLPGSESTAVIVLTAKDLTVEDRRRPNGDVEQIVQKGPGTVSLLSQVRELVAKSLQLKPFDIAGPPFLY